MKRAFALLLAFLLLCGCTPRAEIASSAIHTTIRVTTTPAVHTFAPTNTLLSSTSPTKASPKIESTATPAASKSDLLREKISALSDKELVGQLVMAGFDGTSKPSDVFLDIMSEYKLGNVILFGWNIDSFSQTEKLIDVLNSNNAIPEIPLLIATDVEGGTVRRFNWKPALLSAKELGRLDNTQKVYSQYLRIGKALLEIGVNVDIAPVLDIAPKPNETFLGSRLFGSNPEKVSKLTNAAIRGLREAGVVSIGKHFPGHGNTSTDSHNSLPTIQRDMEQLRAYELIPFNAAIKEGVDGILVGHILYPKIDKSLTSVSSRFINELLRNEMGFDGFIMSDDMRMKALTSKLEIGEAAVQFIESGGDLVLIGKYPEKQIRVLNALYQALTSGRLSRDRLEESALRLLKIKERF